MRPLLAAVNVLVAVSVLAWPLGLFMLLFVHDAPGSESNRWLDALAVAVLLYPVPVVVGNVLFWRRRKREPVGQLVRYTLLTTCGPGLLLLAILALQLACDGRFTCS